MQSALRAQAASPGQSHFVPVLRRRRCRRNGLNAGAFIGSRPPRSKVPVYDEMINAATALAAVAGYEAFLTRKRGAAAR